MKDTVQVTIEVNDESLRDELIATLSALNFDAFEERENALDAFIEESLFDAEKVRQLLSGYKLDFTKTIIKDQNWNALWESNFEPVIVDDFCAVRAFFHQPFTDKEHEIIITPKMSFGTGHHATTFMMMSEMRQIDFKEKQVADFGTGTGVLAILSEKLGSKYVWAIDNDDWSIENSKENIENNGCKKVDIEKADGFRVKQKFDIVLANINKNIILLNADNLASALNENGKMLVSGLLTTDEADVIEAFAKRGLEHISTGTKNGWICLLFIRNKVGIVHQ